MIEDADDLAIFFDGGDFSDEVVMQVGGGPAVTFMAIFDTRPPFTATNFKGFRADDDFGRGLGRVSGSSPRLLCKAADVASIKPSRAGDAQFTVRGVAYFADDIQPDGTGLSLVSLKKA
jgi:hypothetical protein